MDDQEFIPGLPSDIARECLIRIPFTHFPAIRSVSKLWRSEIESSLFHRTRKLSGLTRPVIAFSQSEPAIFPTHKYHTPSYRLNLLDLSTATWHSLPHIPDLPSGLPLFCQLATAAREIVLIGGWDPATWAPLDSVYVYDFVTATWRRGAPMPGPKRSFFACVSSYSGRVVFVAGGHDEEKNALRSALAYDVAGDVWTPLADMARERDECRGVFSDGRFHVIGGYPTERQGQFVKSAEAFDVDTWMWGPVEEGWLDAATCPRTCAAGGCGGRMYMIRGGRVVVREGDAWRDAGEVPEDANVAPTLVKWQGMLMLVGLGGHGGAQAAYVTEVVEGKKLMWQKIEVPPEFSGHVQSACCLQI